MRTKSHAPGGHRPLVLALAFVLLGCGAGGSAPEGGVNGGMAGLNIFKEEKLPLPTERSRP